MFRDFADVRSDRSPRSRRIAVVVAIELIIASIHILRVGSYLDGVLFTLYYSYFSDIVIPVAGYFLLCLLDTEIPVLRDWRVKAFLVFAGVSLTEVLQGFGVPLLGQTFDPFDFVMFGIGALTAGFVDRVLLRRAFAFWRSTE